MGNVLKIWLMSFIHLLVPRRCAACGGCLWEEEEGVCLRCNMDMPRTDYHFQKDNPVERMFWGKMPLERATSYFYYRKGGTFCGILYQLKYEDRMKLGDIMGRLMAAELLPSGFFEDIDVMVPIPLHIFKRWSRGYNQSERIARGVSVVTGIPVDTSSIVRCKYTKTQTRKSVYERWGNVEDIFQLRSPDGFRGKHVLIIDDVLTTGATITACADVLNNVEGVRISVLTLAVAVG